MEPERTRAGPLCSEQYKFLFNSTRIPQKPLDITRTSNPEDNNHIIVVRKNQFFKVSLKKPNGKRMNMAEIKKFQNLTRQLDHIYSVAISSEFPVGSLTTEQRDIWTEVRQELLQISKRNQHSLNDIETAAFVVCLDEDKPISKEEHSVSCWHGDGQNRFFDKSMQFIINDNGKAGFNGEHSMMEATVTHRACDWICSELSKGSVDLGDDSVEIIPLPQKLEFDLNSKVALAINSAIKNFEQLTSKRELVVTTFEGYGKNTIKGFGVSPDAYAQMAIQLAYYKMYRKPCATYESSGTRKFLKGRTETGRSCSVESLKWTRAMVDPSVSVNYIHAGCRPWKVG